MTNALILGRKNGVGLDRDAELLASALRAEGVLARSPEVGGLRAWFSPGAKAEIAFHLERVSPLWKRQAAVHYLIPNQERFPERLVGRLRGIDHVLCKSHHAAEIFSNIHPSVHQIGFTSEDRRLDESQPDYNRFFHLAGRSTLKNTGRLVELWAKHPEWPVLTLVQHPSNAPDSVPSNIDLVSRYLANAELRTLQNRCGMHLCPSLSEGWGHYIVEAMSCRAVTLTTAAPPMDELVQPDRGVLVPFFRSEPRHLGRNFDVDPAKLEEAIGKLIGMSDAEKEKLGAAGRRWFEENDRRFREKLGRVMEELT